MNFSQELTEKISDYMQSVITHFSSIERNNNMSVLDPSGSRVVFGPDSLPGTQEFNFYLGISFCKSQSNWVQLYDVFWRLCISEMCGSGFQSWVVNYVANKFISYL